MDRQYHFVAFSGSFRKDSYNTMALKTLQKLAPDNITIAQLTYADVPFYNADLHTNSFPEEVDNLVEEVFAADAVIFVSPEYNYSIPGGLKNIIDFLSRSPIKPFDNKAIGIMGSSMGNLGTARMQYHLRQVMVFLNAYVMNTPEIMIADAAKKFDKEGNLLDKKTADMMKKFIVSLADFSEKFSVYSKHHV